MCGASAPDDYAALNFEDSLLSVLRPWRDSPSLIGEARTWSWAQVHDEARALCACLDPAETVLNLCDSRLGFLVAWLAAAQRGCSISLPPSGTSADLGSIISTSGRSCIVIDEQHARRGAWPAGVRVITWRPGELVAELSCPPSAPSLSMPTISLFTSGSTGTPKGNLKSASNLIAGANLLARRLGSMLDLDTVNPPALLCSVPPQHMFGLELSVMLPIARGLSVAEARPLLPADVAAALLRCPAGAVWVTTPLHLRALVASGEALRGCRAIITSTMPLDPEVAARAEDLVKAPVIEIFGSTETGALATRRTSQSMLWEPLEGVSFDTDEGGTTANGAHFPSPQPLSDLIEIQADGRFRLIGRDSDLVKVAGKRISLAGLDLLLQRLPGLREGVFHQPRSPIGAGRLVLIFEGPPPDPVAALAWLRQHIDPAFLPRAFIQVERLPRTTNGKIARHALDNIYAQWRDQRT